MTTMRRKQRVEAQRAQLTEAFVLLVAVAWSSWLASSYYDLYQHQLDTAPPTADTPDALVSLLLPRLLQTFNAVALAAVAWPLLTARAVPRTMSDLSRHERDDGLPMGCILPPLVLLSRFLAVGFENESSFSAPTLLFAWTATTASASLLLKISCFGSCGVLPTLFVDCVFLPLLGGFLGVESDLRFVIPTIGRVLIALVFRFGRLALRRSFTVGEALVVAQLLGLAMLDLVLVTFDKIEDNASLWQLAGFPDHRFASAWHLHNSTSQPREPYVLALQVGVIGALLVCAALTPLLSAYGASSPHTVAPSLPAIATIQFLVTVLVVVGLVVYPWSCLLLDTWNPAAWLLAFLVHAPGTRWQLAVYWLACLVVFVPLFAVVSRVLALRQIVARKLFHLLVVIMFIPAFFVSSEMLALSYGVALAIFSLLECVRALALPPLGQQIATFVQPFIDHREGGRVVLTHTYLLLGCALPLWLAPFAPSSFPLKALAANAGVVALGVGDAMGAVVGSTWGKHKLFGGKTLEGTLAVFLSMALASLALVFYDSHWRALEQSGELFPSVVLLLVALLLTSVLEAATSQIDNLVLSLFLFAVVNLAACTHT